MAKASGSVLTNGLSGTAGNVVFVRQPGGGTVVRQRVTPRDPWTPAQAAARAIMTRAGHFYAQLTDVEVEEWERYARLLEQESRLNGVVIRIRTYNAYMSLAARFLALHPESEPPRTPPATSFPGDRIEITATAVEGAVRFEASGPNADDVTTELLLQRLRYAHGGPLTDKYRHQKFYVFSPSGLEIDVPVPPGRYAPAVRFLRLSTAQPTPLLLLPTVRVG